MKLMISRCAAALALAGTVLAGTACTDDDSPTGPSVSEVVGNYAATRLTATSVLGTQDILQAGGSLTMQFASSGALTGHITVPSESVNEDFAGTWKIEDGEIEIEQVAADTFVEDLTFTLVRNTLVADEFFDGVRVRATLTRQ